MTTYSGTPALSLGLRLGGVHVQDEVVSVGAHRWWRLLVLANNGNPDGVALNNLSLYDAGDLDNVATTWDELQGNTGLDEYYISSESPDGTPSFNTADAFDFEGYGGVATSKYDSNLLHPVYVGAVFDQPKDIVRYAVEHVSYDGATSLSKQDMAAAPTLFALQYSDDGLNWTTRHETDTAVLWPADPWDTAPGTRSAYQHTFDIVPIIEGSASLPLINSQAIGSFAYQDIFGDGALRALTGTGTGEAIGVALAALQGTGSALQGQVLQTYLNQRLPSLSGTGTGRSQLFADGVGVLGALQSLGQGFGQGSLVGGIVPTLTGTGTGAGGRSGTIGATLERIEGSGDGYGAADLIGAALPSLSGEAAGNQGRTGTLIAALPPIQSQGDVADTAGSLLPALGGTGVGAGGQAGVVINYLPALQVSAGGYSEADLVGSILPPISASAVGISGISGPVQGSLPALAGAGAISNTGAGSPLPALGGAGVGATGQAGVLINYLPALQVSAGGYSDADLVGSVLPRLAVLASGIGGENGAIIAPLPAISATGTASDTGGVRLPALVGAGSAATGQAGYGTGRLGALSAAGQGFSDADLIGSVLERLESLGTGSAGVAGSLIGSLPRLSASGVLSHAGTGAPLPALTGAGVAAVGQGSVGYLYLQRLSGTGAGTNVPVDGPSVGGIDAALPLIGGTGLGVVGNVYAGAATLGRLSMAAGGALGQLGSLNVVLPVMAGTGQGYASAQTSVALTLPALVGTGQVIGALLEPMATGQGLVLNVAARAMSNYQGPAFQSMAMVDGVTLACSPAGIFALIGDTDAGVAIDASVRLGKLDFQIDTLKMVDAVHLGYQADGSLVLSARMDDGTEYDYPIESRLSGRHTTRTKLGRGLKGRYLEVGVRNVDGADFAIDTLELDPRPIRRRVR